MINHRSLDLCLCHSISLFHCSIVDNIMGVLCIVLLNKRSSQFHGKKVNNPLNLCLFFYFFPWLSLSLSHTHTRTPTQAHSSQISIVSIRDLLSYPNSQFICTSPLLLTAWVLLLSVFCSYLFFLTSFTIQSPLLVPP